MLLEIFLGVRGHTLPNVACRSVWFDLHSIFSFLTLNQWLTSGFVASPDRVNIS